jgi:hypothetical protein
MEFVFCLFFMFKIIHLEILLKHLNLFNEISINLATYTAKLLLETLTVPEAIEMLV